MHALRSSGFASVLLLATCLATPATAAVTVYFSPEQVATPVSTGVTVDEVSCAGYVFSYTRDKLFTGGGPTPIGRNVRVPWPAGVEAQYVTSGPAPTKAELRVRRLDGGLFDLTSFTALLLANAGAGRALEIVPLLNGEEPFNDPFMFDVSGNYGNSFSYDTSPNPWGSTAPLVNFDEYAIRLTLDFALTALTLSDASAPVSVGPGTARTSSALRAAPNPARSPVSFTLASGALAPGTRLEVYSVRGERVRQLRAGGDGTVRWDLTDDARTAVPAGLYFVRAAAGEPAQATLRVAVTR